MEPPFDRATAYGSYDGALRDLIHLLKYEQVRPAGRVLGRMLAEVLEDLVPKPRETGLLVVPVPLHVRKLRQRGFNQSELIAREAIKISHRPELMLHSSALLRTRFTESQTGMSRAQRRANMRGAFAVAHPKEVAERDILLVDDVFTTGTTVTECARVLRQAGAGCIWVATVARVLHPESAHAGFAEPGAHLEDAVLRCAAGQA